MGCGELMVPCLIESWVRQILGAVPDDFKAVFEEVKIGFIGRIAHKFLQS